jgi:hypothetical protein
VSFAALFCGQREDRIARPGLFFPGRFFRPAAARRSPHLGPLMRTFGRQAAHVATQPGAFTLRVPRIRAVAAKTLATAHLSRGQRRSARGEPMGASCRVTLIGGVDKLAVYFRARVPA